jgi:hypothetical protein
MMRVGAKRFENYFVGCGYDSRSGSVVVASASIADE